MGAESENLRVPRLSRADLGGLPLGPFEGYVLSLVDGKATTQQIADATGADVPAIIKLVDSLREVGAAEWVPLAGSGVPLRITTKPPPPPDTSRVLYDPSELYEDDVDLGEERRRAILDTFYRLDELNFYDLLKVPRNADKKAIRDSYFRMSKQFHPDTMFGKKLGTFKSKMEAVFNGITNAYEVLGKKKKRVDYDLYLGLTDTTRAAEWDIAQAESDAAVLEAEQNAMEAEQGELVRARPAKAEATNAEATKAEATNAAATKAEATNAGHADAGPRATSPRDAVPPSAPAKNPSTPARPSRAASKPSSLSPPGGRSADERKRIARELMMRRFSGAPGLSQLPPRASTVPSSGGSDTAERSRHDVLRGLAGSLRSAAQMTGGIDRVAVQVRLARQAEAEGDLLGATNGYRLALSLADDPVVRADYERVRAILAGELAENYEKQAQYEEEYSKWGAAALSWKKVAEGRPNSAEPLCRAANAIVRSGGDLKHAKELAQEAVRLMPGNKQCRIVLAKVFIAAGMKRSAKSELEEAGKLDPSDEIVKNLLLDLRD